MGFWRQKLGLTKFYMLGIGSTSSAFWSCFCVLDNVSDVDKVALLDWIGLDCAERFWLVTKGTAREVQVLLQ